MVQKLLLGATLRKKVLTQIFEVDLGEGRGSVGGNQVVPHRENFKNGSGKTVGFVEEKSILLGALGALTFFGYFDPLFLELFPNNLRKRNVLTSDLRLPGRKIYLFRDFGYYSYFRSQSEVQKSYTKPTSSNIAYFF